MGEEAARNRDALRQTIETKLDDAATKQATAARELREEMTASFGSLSEGSALRSKTSAVDLTAASKQSTTASRRSA